MRVLFAKRDGHSCVTKHEIDNNTKQFRFETITRHPPRPLEWASKTWRLLFLVVGVTVAGWVLASLFSMSENPSTIIYSGVSLRKFPQFRDSGSLTAVDLSGNHIRTCSLLPATVSELHIQARLGHPALQQFTLIVLCAVE